MFQPCKFCVGLCPFSVDDHCGYTGDLIEELTKCGKEIKDGSKRKAPRPRSKEATSDVFGELLGEQ
jgi:hypothetical protein